MSMSDSVAEIAKKLAELYREVVTTSARFEELQRSTDRTLTRYERVIEQLSDKMSLMQSDHIRERAELLAEIRALNGRLNALGEQAIHAVARDAARELLSETYDRSSNLPEQTEHGASVVLRLPVKRETGA
jgi:chromosome segregation ATPase